MPQMQYKFPSKTTLFLNNQQDINSEFQKQLKKIRITKTEDNKYDEDDDENDKILTILES